MVVFKIADEVFASDIDVVREVIKLENLTPVPSSHDYIAGIVNIRGRIVPVMDLGSLLNVGPHDTNGAFILLIDTPNKEPVGMIVNNVTEIRHFSLDEIKTAPKILASKVAAEFIAGVILPESGTDDESVILLINLEAVIDASVARVLEQIRAGKESTLNGETA